MRHFSFVVVALALIAAACSASDPLRELQNAAVEQNKSDIAHWGHNPNNYTQWSSHSLRLIPVYTFGTAGGGPGVDLNSYLGEHSPYRDETAVRRIYGFLPTNTVNPQAEYGDQTALAELQRAAAAAGKKHIFLVVFDGMDWQTTQAAAIYQTGKVAYDEGRGTGLHFLDYTAGDTTQYGYVVTAPTNDGTNEDVNTQSIPNPGGTAPGGFNAAKAGTTPWDSPSDPDYILGRSSAGGPGEHPYPDSANTATSLTSGQKSYNGAINVDPSGNQVSTVAHELQEQGWSIGVVSSVPISHATPAAAYGHNVGRDDYQDLTRDLVGLASISHPDSPLPGVDVLIGTGFGDIRQEAKGQGTNFVPGNAWIADPDVYAIDATYGGRYIIAQRTAGTDGADLLQNAAEQAAAGHKRLFGQFGTKAGHLPFRTADGDYEPARGRGGKPPEAYDPADLTENPTLADMTAAALTVLQDNPHGSWLMVEAGDVDWANHDNNLDNSIGAVVSGDMAIKVITDWVEAHSNWNDSLLIVTSDHGHDLNVVKPEVIAEAGRERPDFPAEPAQ